MAKKKSFDKRFQKSVDTWMSKRSTRTQWIIRLGFVAAVYAGLLTLWVKTAGTPVLGYRIPKPDLQAWAGRPAMVLAGVGVFAVVVAGWTNYHRVARSGLRNPAVHVAALVAAAPGMIRQESDRTPIVLEGFAGSYKEAPDGTISWHHKLPAGVVFEDVGRYAGRSRYIASLDQDVAGNRYEIEPWQGRVNWIGVTIRPELPPLTGRPAALSGLADWHVPLPIGRDKTTGQDVTIRLSGHASTLIAGQSGSGKTWLMRVIVGQVANLPNVTLWVADGKDDVGCDWSLLKHRAEKWVGLQDDNAPQAYVALLESALAEMKRRYSTTGVTHPLLLILLEEYAGLRDMIGDDKVVAKVDDMVRQLVMKCRAANIHVVIATQHPSTAAIPSAIRDQCATRICLHMPARRSAEMVLGYQPAQEDMPSKEQHGHALVDINGELTKVLCDEVTDDTWAGFCETLMSIHDPVDDTPQDTPDAGPTLPAEYQRIVVEAMTVTALWKALPVEVRGSSAAVLSKHLLPQIGVTPVRKKTGAWVYPGAGLPSPDPVLPSLEAVLPSPAVTADLHLVREPHGG